MTIHVQGYVTAICRHAGCGAQPEHATIWSCPPEAEKLHLERKPTPGLELELDIVALSAKGFGTAPLAITLGPQRLERRYTVRVREALPGERIRARVYAVKRRIIDAELLTLIKPAAGRIEGRCRHFGPRHDGRRGCGGCVLQTLPHREQVTLKRDFVADLFTAAGLAPTLLREPLIPQDPWYYRNKMEYSFASTRDLPFALGLHPWGYHREVLPLQECHLLSTTSSQLLPRFASYCAERGIPPFLHQRNEGWLRTLTLREGKRTGERMAVLTTSAAPQIATSRGEEQAESIAAELAAVLRQQAATVGGELSCIYWSQQHTERRQPTRFIDTHLYGDPVLHEELHIELGSKRQQLRFEIHPRAFFQPNTLQAEVLYGEVARAAGLQEGATGRILDLYCGTGTIALCLAPFCQEVIGAELEQAAVENARRNALFNGIENARFVAGDVGKLLGGELAALLGEEVSCVIVDPPRSGLSPQALDHIAHIRSQRMVYVSCGPEALARDLVALRRFGLEPRYVQPVDMFPHTAHIENVALLSRGD